MRRLIPLVAWGVTLGCGNEVEHPDRAPDCDAATMDCGTYKPPMAGTPSGSQGGSGSSSPQGATVSGEVLSFVDDFFEIGRLFEGDAEVSAIGESGARVTADYDGTAFELDGVRKDAANWFMVVPEQGSAMLTTITPVDTRMISSEVVPVGLVAEATVDGMYVLIGTERSQQRAQVVVRVVDEQGRSLSGVVGALTAEVVAYREAGSWLMGDLQTDDSGMIFFGNVPAGPALAQENIIFSGAVSASVETRTMAGATTFLTAVVSPP